MRCLIFRMNSLALMAYPQCLMVDIDPIVCETSKKFLEQHHAGAFDNPRFQVRASCSIAPPVLTFAFHR